MSNETDDTILGTIHYIDFGNYYMVYGISTLIIVLLLLWYFVRSNLETNITRCKNCYKKINNDKLYCNSCVVSKKNSISNRCSLCKIKNIKKYDILSEMEAKLKTEDHTYVTNKEEMSNIENVKVTNELPELTMRNIVSNNNYKMRKGTYGGVEINIYDVKPYTYGPEEWTNEYSIYTPNTRTSFKNINTPKESLFWKDDSIDGIDGIPSHIKNVNSDEDICMDCLKKRPNCLCNFRIEKGGPCLLCENPPRNCECSMEELLRNKTKCKNCAKRTNDCKCKSIKNR